MVRILTVIFSLSLCPMFIQCGGGGSDMSMAILALAGGGEAPQGSGWGGFSGYTEPQYELNQSTVTPDGDVLSDYYGSGVDGYLVQATPLEAGGEHPQALAFAHQNHNQSYPVHFYMTRKGSNFYIRESVVGYEFNSVQTHPGTNAYSYTSPSRYYYSHTDDSFSINTISPSPTEPVTITTVRSLIPARYEEYTYDTDLYTADRSQRGMSHTWSFRRHLRINLIFIDGANANANFDDFAPAINKLKALFAQPTVAVDLEITSTTVPSDSDLLTIDDLDDESGTSPGSLRYLIASTGEYQDKDSVNIIITEEEIQVGGVLGISGGLPGMVGITGTLQNAVVVFVNSHQSVSGLPLSYSELEFIGTTMAHEVGHYLGLSHLVESGGSRLNYLYREDPLIETPTCAYYSDDNDDDIVSISECNGTGVADAGATNAMFWAGDPGFVQDDLTGEQGWLIRRHPLVY